MSDNNVEHMLRKYLFRVQFKSYMIYNVAESTRLYKMFMSESSNSDRKSFFDKLIIIKKKYLKTLPVNKAHSLVLRNKI